MLARARENVPQGKFHDGDLHALPLPDDAVDVIVCAVALVHLADIEGPFCEFARVLRPGGHLVVSDQCGLIGNIGFPVVFDGSELDRSESELGYMPVYPRSASEYLAAALPLGFRVLRCEEPHVPWPLLDEQGRTIHDGERLPPQDPNEPFSIWNLHAEAIEATNAAWYRKPSSIIWHFQLPNVDSNAPRELTQGGLD